MPKMLSHKAAAVDMGSSSVLIFYCILFVLASGPKKKAKESGSLDTVNYLPPHGNQVSAHIDCSHPLLINVTLLFTYPFTGYVYLDRQFQECIPWIGIGDTILQLQVGLGHCGQVVNGSGRHLWIYEDSVIEQRLVIQYDRELVTEGDVNVQVRCEIPAAYNKTVHVQVDDSGKTIHTEIQAFMEIQAGGDPEIQSSSNYIFRVSQPLILIIQAYHKYLFFDANIVSCVALEAFSTTKKYGYSGGNRISIINKGCSSRRDIFSNVFKRRIDNSWRQNVVQWVNFKGFRLPTTGRITIGCELQVCFKKCPITTTCRDSYSPFNKIRKRQRRDVAEVVVEKRILMSRTIDIELMSSDMPLAVHTGQHDYQVSRKCEMSMTCYWSLVVFSMSTVSLLCIGIYCFYHSLIQVGRHGIVSRP